jgi:hypothetical protein
MDKDTRKFANRWIAVIIALAIAGLLYRTHNQTAQAVTQFILQKLVDAIGAWAYILGSFLFGFLFAEWRRGTFKAG